MRDGSCPKTGRLAFEVVRTPGGLDALRSEWESLFARCGRAHHVFQQHSWLWHWTRTLHSGDDELAVIVGRRNGKLQLVLPLVGETKLGVRFFKWMGQPVGQYSDALVAEEATGSRELVSALNFIKDNLGCDVLIASQVREDAAIRCALETAGARVASEEIAPSIDLRRLQGLVELDARFGAKMRRNRRRLRKLIHKQGSLRMRLLPEGSEARAAVDKALAFKAEWFEKHAILSRAYTDPRFGSFWRQVAGSLDRPVGLRAAVLELDGRPIAIEIALRYKGVHCAHIGAFDLAFEKFSPGQQQMDAVIEACIAGGVEEYDLLPPNADYKARLADRRTVVRNYVLAMSATGLACDALRLTELDGLVKSALKTMPSGLRRAIRRAIDK